MAKAGTSSITAYTAFKFRRELRALAVLFFLISAAAEGPVGAVVGVGLYAHVDEDQCVDTHQIWRRPWEELRRLSSRSLDGSNGVGTVATYINANIRTNTSLVSDRVRMGSEHLSPMFTKWRIGGVVFARWISKAF